MKKHIHAHIAHAAQSVEHIVPWQCHMEEDDEEHRRPHQLASESANIRQFYIFYLVHVAGLFIYLDAKVHKKNDITIEKA